MKKNILAIGILLFAVSCEKEIKLKETESEPRTVVNSIFADNDTITVNLSESRNVLYEGELPVITDATVTLSDENGTELGTFSHTEKGEYILADPKPVAGKTYQLKVVAPGKKTVTAQSEAPSILAISNVDTTTQGISNNRIRFDITINDEPTRKNYYAVAINQVISTDDGMGNFFTSEYPYFSTKEVIVVNGDQDIDGDKYGTEFFFSDATFNGQEFEFTGYHEYPQWVPPGDFYYVVSLISMSEDLYKYKLSYSKYLSTSGSPFAEPVQVYSNITDGFGIFGGYSTYRDTIFVE